MTAEVTLEARLGYLNGTLAAMGDCWPRVAQEIQQRIDDKTAQLIGENNEQTRGAIKALRDLLELPAALQHERDHISAALSDPDAA
ncbi:hypothetical protein [Janthinobacterium sp. RA13]|uniref:hypothetical protein n=1 Tax=Janthinobacterium sp. RA13 TaxID=1502762 RepID=UPI0005642BAA|nr:hypothetical protein [Janthinobacterium sp. RA13]